MITLDLPSDLERRLNEAARESGESPSAIAEAALLDWMDALKDTRRAGRRPADPDGGRRESVPLEEILRRHYLTH